MCMRIHILLSTPYHAARFRGQRDFEVRWDFEEIRYIRKHRRKKMDINFANEGEIGENFQLYGTLDVCIWLTGSVMGSVMPMICPASFHSGRSGTEGACTLNVTGPCSVCVCVCVCVCECVEQWLLYACLPAPSRLVVYRKFTGLSNPKFRGETIPTNINTNHTLKVEQSHHPVALFKQHRVLLKPNSQTIYHQQQVEAIVTKGVD